MGARRGRPGGAERGFRAPEPPGARAGPSPAHLPHARADARGGLGHLLRPPVDGVREDGGEAGGLRPRERAAQRNLSVKHIIAAANRVLRPYVLDVREIAWWCGALLRVPRRRAERRPGPGWNRLPTPFSGEASPVGEKPAWLAASRISQLPIWCSSASEGL